ncbi:hypothetical protein VPH35_043474 [Triticum aestivum]
MASALPWKPLFWERVENSRALAAAARGDLAAAAAAAATIHLALASPLRAGDLDRAVSLIGESEDKLAAAGKQVAFLFSGLGTVELLARRRIRGDDSVEQQARPRAREARARAGAAYDDVALSRGHLGAAARLVACGDLPDIYFRAEFLAATEPRRRPRSTSTGWTTPCASAATSRLHFFPCTGASTPTRARRRTPAPSGRKNTTRRGRPWHAPLQRPAALLHGCADLGKCVNAVMSSAVWELP